METESSTRGVEMRRLVESFLEWDSVGGTCVLEFRVAWPDKHYLFGSQTTCLTVSLCYIPKLAHTAHNSEIPEMALPK